MKKLFFFLLCSLIVPFLVRSQGITVYWDGNYSGKTMVINQDISWIGNEWNDKISSIRIPNGYQIQVFRDANYGGASLTLDRDWNYSSSPGWNDQISSIRILRFPERRYMDRERDRERELEHQREEERLRESNRRREEEERRKEEERNRAERDRSHQVNPNEAEGRHRHEGGQVKADNVGKVEYDNGITRGAFRREGDRRWIERNNTGTFRFVEVKSDEWSVYLKDDSRHVTVQIDLLQKKIFLDPWGNQRRELYTIARSER